MDLTIEASEPIEPARTPLRSLSRNSRYLEITPRVGEHSFVEVRTPLAAQRTAEFRIEEPAIVDRYHLPVDPEQFDRATAVNLRSFKRPHMRIFHLAYLSGITGFIGWYAIPPLMPTIKTQLGLTDGEVLNSDIASTASTIISRVAVGPLLDAYGPQAVQSTLLWFGAIPIISAAFVNSSTTLLIVRFFVGLIGCVFVSGQYWTTITFARNVVGTANAINGGIGLAGIGFAFLLLPFINEFLTSVCNVSTDAAWRVTIVLPAALMLIMGTVIRYVVDSCPMGAFENLARAKQQLAEKTQTPKASLIQSFRIVLSDPNALIMIMHYGVCFGTELQLNNMGALYFYNSFLTRDDCTAASEDESCHVLTKTNAAAVASAFGLMNLFARALGGLASDTVNRHWGMTGRKCVQFTLLCVLGSLVLVLSRLDSLGPCIVLYVLVAIAAQATGGSTYGIVPYLNEQYTGTVNGLVGAGGNLGGVIYGIIFRATSSYSSGLFIMAFIIYASALFVPLVRFKNAKIAQDTDVQEWRGREFSKQRQSSELLLDELQLEIDLRQQEEGPNVRAA